MEYPKDYSTAVWEFVGKSISDNDFVPAALFTHVKLLVGFAYSLVYAVFNIHVRIFGRP